MPSVWTSPLSLTEPTESDVIQDLKEQAADARMMPYFTLLMAHYRESLAMATGELARLVCQVPGPVHLVSVMRAGLPIGLALSRIARRAGREFTHELLPFVRGDSGALDRGAGAAGTTVVVDGWTGSADTLREIRRRWKGDKLILAALVDPAGYCDLAGTRGDLLCPHALLQQRMSLGLGRFRFDPQRGVVATASAWDASALEDYVTQLITPPVRASVSYGDAYGGRVGSVDAPGVDRTRCRLGINECWRAFARDELGGLIVDLSAGPSLGVSLLSELARVPIRFADLDGHSCLGLISEAGV